jgi:hypothetical protein
MVHGSLKNREQGAGSREQGAEGRRQKEKNLRLKT